MYFGDYILIFMTFVMMSIIWVMIGLHWIYPVLIFIICLVLNVVDKGLKGELQYGKTIYTLGR